jgi:cytochrome P450
MMEETLRYSHIAPAVLRQATVDTQILGYHIPKGTNIFLNTSAASFMQPAFEIDEARRRESARVVGGRQSWDPEDVEEFVPERWLKMENRQQEGETENREVFDSRAGPMLAFGVGHRSCFGRKLVYLDLQIAMTLLTWSFEFLELGQLNNFEAVDSLSQRPRDCYVRLRKIEY